jgi:outer membrane receptor for Fe3+-dicitrate
MMEGEYAFYQEASGLPVGLSLADYKHNFYSNNAPLKAEITDPQDDDVLAYESTLGKWINKVFGG